MLKKKSSNNHNPHTQLYKNWITLVSANHIKNILNFYPTHNIKCFKQFFTDISDGMLCPYPPNQQNILSFEPDNFKNSVLNRIYGQITHESDILPEKLICPDFLNVSQAYDSINIYEMKAKMQTEGKDIPPISMNFGQVIKYMTQANKWASDLNINSDLMIICYLYTLDTEIRNINSIPEVAKHLHIKDIVLIPYEYIKEYNLNFAKKVEEFKLDIEKIELGDTAEINRLENKIKKNTKNNSAFFTMSSKEIYDIINQKGPNTFQTTLKTPAEVIEGYKTSLKTPEQDIRITCIENGKRLDTFFKEITGSFTDLENIYINNGLLEHLNSADYKTGKNTYSTKKTLDIY
ncbi:MAG: hypothetical protein KAJ47_01040 [Candidatus Aenigmarchaeota archaeon]|nr:hypothetical protein [Candidatus Aenigmarchaeota archaeon]